MRKMVLTSAVIATVTMQLMESTAFADSVVLKAEVRLWELGYDPGTPDGIFGAKASAALRQCQEIRYSTSKRNQTVVDR